jgi:hypothetical protein
MKSLKFVITFIDGSEAELLSPLSDRKSSISWFRSQPDVEIEGVYYTRNSIFSWFITEVV